MRLARELFFELVHKVEESGQFSNILEKQQTKYQLQPFKLQGIDCKAIKRIYQGLQSKYYETHQLSEDPHNWNQNQRRVFIWYIIFYTYFLTQEGRQLNQEHWPMLSSIFFNKKGEFLQFQYLSMIKPTKLSWTQDEDKLLTESVRQEGAGRWNEVAKYFFFTSNFTTFKSPKHCRQRWLNHLDDKKKHGQWSLQEDLKIFNYVTEYGKRWCKLVTILDESRTEHMIKNRYNSLLNKHKGNKKEREEVSVSKIRKQLKKQLQNYSKKKQKKEQSQLKVPNQEQIEKMQAEQKGQRQVQNDVEKTLVKMEMALDVVVDNQLVPSEKTSSHLDIKIEPLKEEQQVSYIVHEMKQQKNNTQQVQKVKSEQCEPQINHIQLEYPFQLNNNYPFLDHYNGLGFVPNYPCYWL